MATFFRPRPGGQKPRGSFSVLIDNLYDKAEHTAPPPYSEEELIEEALLNIYNRSVDVKDRIEPNLYEATSKTYRKAVDEGFGTVHFGEPDYDFVNALKHNTDVLAAFKTHRQQNDISGLMLDEKGKLKPFSRFRQDVEGVIGKYNRNWLATEYNTAVIRARHAARWKDFERDADLYPNLMWLPSTSVHPDKKVHIRFWNRIWAITDPFWKRHYPGDRWNCKCGLTNTDQPVTDNTDLYDENEFKEVRPDAGIDANAGLTGEIFTARHPYITQAYPGAEKAVKEFIKEDIARTVKEARKELEKWYKENLPVVKVGKFETKRFEIYHPDMNGPVIVNRKFYEETASKYKNSSDYVMRLKWAQRAHLLFKESVFVCDEVSAHHPDAQFKVFLYQKEGVDIEFKCKVNADGIYLYYMKLLH